MAGNTNHDDVIKWKHFPRYWPFVRGIHRSRWIPRTKASDAELWCFFFICAWINDWVNIREAGDFRRHRGHYDVNVMWSASTSWPIPPEKHMLNDLVVRNWSDAPRLCILWTLSCLFTQMAIVDTIAVDIHCLIRLQSQLSVSRYPFWLWYKCWFVWWFGPLTKQLYRRLASRSCLEGIRRVPKWFSCCEK